MAYSGEKNFFKRRSLVALSLFCGAVILWWWNPLWLTRPIQTVLVTVTAPFQNMLAWASFELSDAGTFFGSIGNLKHENSRLEKENLKLTAEVARLQALEVENANLRDFAKLEHYDLGTLVASEVIGRDGSGLSTLIRINRGSVQGVKVGQPVIGSGSILVGRVISVAPITAEVRLLPHPESMVSAVLASTDSNGIVRGDHGLGMIFDLALQSDSLRPGEAVVTSGLGDNFPRGLLIGKIESIQPSLDRLFQQAVLVSPLHFENLHFVAVITE